MILREQQLRHQQPMLDVSPSKWSLGRLVPLTMVLWCLLDLGLRFGPIDWLKIKPEQMARRLPGRFAPFTPNFSRSTDHYAGALAVLGNLPPTQTRPALTFSTDGFGFRATPGLSADEAPQVLVMGGDSYVWGGGLSDEQTFPALLARQLEVGVYNAGRFSMDPDGLKELDWLLERLRSERLTVIYVYKETFDLKLDKVVDQEGWIDRAGAKVIGTQRYTPLKNSLSSFQEFLLEEKRIYGEWWAVSPLQIAINRWYRRLCNDNILPNEYRERVAVRYLPDGRRFLLQPRAIERYQQPPAERVIRQTAEYLKWLGAGLRARNSDLKVVLLPSAVSVYGPYLRGEPALPDIGADHYLNRLERELVRRQVRVINAFTLLRAAAAQDVATGQLSFYLDDHHWNLQGVERVTDAVVQSLREDGWQPAQPAQAPQSTRTGSARK